MKKTVLMAVLLIIVSMTAFAEEGKARVTFQLENRERADLYLNGQKKGEIRAGKLEKIMDEGKYEVEVKENLKDKSYWYYKETIEVYEGDITTIPIKMELNHTEEYYIEKEQYYEYMAKYPKGKYTKQAKDKIKKIEKEKAEILKKEKAEIERVEKIPTSIREISKNMVLVEGGNFRMGSYSGEYDERPIHGVTVNSFYISKYEVKQSEFNIVMGYNPSFFKDDGTNKPVETVSWYDAVLYCNTLSEKEDLKPYYSITNIEKIGDNIKSADVKILGGRGYRLPTEAEWEYVAKGGKNSKGYNYSGSNDLEESAWYSKNSLKTTHDAGGKVENELGIYDMSGNVREWCWDIKANYSGEDQINPTGAETGDFRVVRGGSWLIDGFYCRLENRYSFHPMYKHSNLGFRYARNIDE